MRFFLAQSAALDDYDGLKARFSPCLQGRWRREASLHATVLFLGERFTAAEIVAAVAATPYRLEAAPIEGVAFFERNRIFYAACEYPSLSETYRRLSRAFGLQASDAYTPHVTLMRYKRMDTDCLRDAADGLKGAPLGRVGGGLKLMQSTLTAEGTVYETVHRF